MRSATKRGPEWLGIKLRGRDLTVSVRRNPRAKRLILRVDAVSGQPVVTLPARTSLEQGAAFLRKHIDWLEHRLGTAVAPVAFLDGAVFMLRGEPCRIVHRGGRGLARFRSGPETGELSVTGDVAHLSRRVTDFLKREARGDFTAAVERHTARLGKPHAGLRIGDARSRWGSCTAKGVLTFSWRLILAPPYVLDYLAAHEVAHLAEMNHGPRFWALVRRLDPDHDQARQWLRLNGAGLHAVGRAPEARSAF